MDAQPNVTHLALVALLRCGLVHEWLTTNYDGLAQKAGCPQEQVAELHGSWFDPSNPIIGKGGKMRQDLALRLGQAAEAADLVLVLGSSLTGGSSICAASRPAQRSLEGSCLGLVVVNLQATPLDGQATVRVFADTDTLMQRLIAQLNISLEAPKLVSKIKCEAMVPYDSSGNKSSTVLTELCLKPGSGVRLSQQHNCQGAGQPSRAHIGGGELVREGGRVTRRAKGEGRVVRYCTTQRAWELEVDNVKMLLGYWWLDAAARGNIPFLPLVNIGAKPARFQTIVRQKMMKTQKVAFCNERAPLKIGHKKEIGSDGAQSEGELDPLEENNPRQTDCVVGQKNSDEFLETISAVNQNAHVDDITPPPSPTVGGEPLESKIEEPPRSRNSPTTSNAVPSPTPAPSDDKNRAKKDPEEEKTQKSELQVIEFVDSGYETAVPFDDERSHPPDKIIETPEEILAEETESEARILPSEVDPRDPRCDAGSKTTIEEEYEDKYDADDFEVDDEM